MSMDKQELFERIRAMEEDEQRIAVRAIASNILIEEYVRRFETQEEMISGARRSLRMEKDDYGIKSKGSDGRSEERQDD